MDPTTAGLLYKVVSLLVGLAFAYMGYRLFMSSVWGQAGELDAQFGKNKILLKKAAPGTFFVLFGAIVVALTIWKGWTIDYSSQRQEMAQEQNHRLSREDAPEPPVNPDIER